MDSEHQEVSIRDLYPELSDQELKEAEQNLENYLEVALRIFDRIENEQLSEEQGK